MKGSKTSPIEEVCVTRVIFRKAYKLRVISREASVGKNFRSPLSGPISGNKRRLVTKYITWMEEK